VWFALVAAIAAINPPRVAAALAATPEPERRRPLTVGTIVAAAILLMLAAAASWLLDVLDVTDETWRIAAGAVAVLAGARHVTLDSPSPVPRLSAPLHALAPVAFPVLLVPEAVLLTILYGATEGMATTLLALAAGVLPVPFVGRAELGPTIRGSFRFLAAVLVVVGIGLIVAGIRDV
jgi:small neutral amino acid transporter SnatA (MarC family)